MLKVKMPKFIMFSRTLKLVFQYFFTLLWGQVLLLAASIFILKPIVSNSFRLALKVSGFSYVTGNNLLPFLVNPVTLLIVLLLLIVLSVFILLNIIYLIIFFTYIQNNTKPRLVRVFALTIYNLVKCFHIKNLKMVPQLYLLILLWNLPLIYMVVNKVRFFRYFTDMLENDFIILLSATIGLGLLILVILRNRLLILPSLLAKKYSCSNAVKESITVSKSRGLKTILHYIIWNFGIVFVFLLIYGFIMGLTALFVIGIPNRNLAIATFISFNDNINWYLMLLSYTLSTVGNTALITSMYQIYVRRSHTLAKSLDEVIIKREYSYKRIISIAVIVLVVINCYFFFSDIRNGSPLDYMNLDKIQVTSHRGFSHSVPENTLPAIEKAIEEQADYVEVDVRVTKDGELVLLHDNNLKRTTGLNKKIWDVNYSDIFDLDAGSWMSKEYAGTKIPTLREVFELAKGKIMLNLDLKYHSKEEGMVEKVVALIDEYDMEWQCVVTSTNLNCLEEVKELNADIRTGYITYQIYSGLYENEAIDFFSMKANLVSKGVVRQVHKHGKVLHVWTVNTRTELERLKRIGVDNIITDNPAFAKQVLYQESDKFLLTLLKIMME